MPYTYPYRRPSVTVDLVVIGYDTMAQQPSLLLIRRGRAPHAGRLALPGGFVDVSDTGTQGESTTDAAIRELREETGLVTSWTMPLGIADAPGRDPRGRVISIVHAVAVQGTPTVAGGDDAADALWIPMRDVRSTINNKAFHNQMAFDHADIIRRSLVALVPWWRTWLTAAIMPAVFPIAALVSAITSGTGSPMDPGNAQRLIRRLKILDPVGPPQCGTAGRPAQQFSINQRAVTRAFHAGHGFPVPRAAMAAYIHSLRPGCSLAEKP